MPWIEIKINMSKVKINKGTVSVTDVPALFNTETKATEVKPIELIKCILEQHKDKLEEDERAEMEKMVREEFEGSKTKSNN